MSESSDDGRLAERISDRPIFGCCQGRGYHLMLCRNNSGRDENLRQLALRHGIWAGFESARLDLWADAPPSILLVEPGMVVEVDGKLYRVTGKTPGENGAVSFELEPWHAD